MTSFLNDQARRKLAAIERGFAALARVPGLAEAAQIERLRRQHVVLADPFALREPQPDAVEWLLMAEPGGGAPVDLVSEGFVGFGYVWGAAAVGPDGRVYFVDADCRGSSVLYHKHGDIAEQLARANDEASLLAFVVQFGLPRNGLGTSLAFLERHRDAVRTALRLLHALQMDEEEPSSSTGLDTHVGELLRQFEDNQNPDWFDIPFAGPREVPYHEAFQNLIAHASTDPRSIARDYLSGLFEVNLGELEMRVISPRSGPSTEFHRAHLVRDPIEAVYPALIRLAESRRQFERCEFEGCGAVFALRDARMKFCTKRCADTARKRRQRARRDDRERTTDDLGDGQLGRPQPVAQSRSNGRRSERSQGAAG